MKQYTHVLAPGDFLTLFTDGFSEAMNQEDATLRHGPHAAAGSGPIQERGRPGAAHSRRRPQFRRRCPKRRYVPGLLRSRSLIARHDDETAPQDRRA